MHICPLPVLSGGGAAKGGVVGSKRTKHCMCSVPAATPVRRGSAALPRSLSLSVATLERGREGPQALPPQGKEVRNPLVERRSLREQTLLACAQRPRPRNTQHPSVLDHPDPLRRIFRIALAPKGALSLLTLAPRGPGTSRPRPRGRAGVLCPCHGDGGLWCAGQKDTISSPMGGKAQRATTTTSIARPRPFEAPRFAPNPRRGRMARKGVRPRMVCPCRAHPHPTTSLSLSFTPHIHTRAITRTHPLHSLPPQTNPLLSPPTK